MAQLEVYPSKSGWRWRREGHNPSKEFDSRSEAFEDALLERDTEAIVLLRQDGSLHGELYHESRAGGGQRVDILAASTRDGAEGLDG